MSEQDNLVNLDLHVRGAVTSESLGLLRTYLASIAVGELYIIDNTSKSDIYPTAEEVETSFNTIYLTRYKVGGQDTYLSTFSGIRRYFDDHNDDDVNAETQYAKVMRTWNVLDTHCTTFHSTSELASAVDCGLRPVFKASSQLVQGETRIKQELLGIVPGSLLDVAPILEELHVGHGKSRIRSSSARTIRTYINGISK